MKRLCSIIMVLLLCLAMAVPVFAAEQQEYVFELMPSISMFDSFDFVSDDGVVFLYEGRLPEGMYEVTYFWYTDSGIGTAVLDEPICINYSTEFDGFMTSVHCFTFSGFFGTVSFDVFLADSFSELGASVMVPTIDFSSDSSVGYPYFVFTSVGSSWKLADYFNADTLAATLDHLIALLPVVLSVIVGYIGLRKAIGWMLSVLRSS